MKLNTVNVIELKSDFVSSLRAFPDDTTGNKEAEKLFEQLVKEHENNDVPQKDMEVYLEEGAFDDDCGYQVVLVHSQLL